MSNVDFLSFHISLLCIHTSLSSFTLCYIVQFCIKAPNVAYIITSLFWSSRYVCTRWPLWLHHFVMSYIGKKQTVSPWLSVFFYFIFQLPFNRCLSHVLQIHWYVQGRAIIHSVRYFTINCSMHILLDDVLLKKMYYNDVIMSTTTSQITSLTIVYSSVNSGRSKKTSKLRVNGLCAGNSPVTGEFPAQRASNAENVCIWWRHHGLAKLELLSLTQNQRHFTNSYGFKQISYGFKKWYIVT